MGRAALRVCVCVWEWLHATTRCSLCSTGLSAVLRPDDSHSAPQRPAEDTTTHKYSIYGYLARTIVFLTPDSCITRRPHTHIQTSYVSLSPLVHAGKQHVSVGCCVAALIVDPPPFGAAQGGKLEADGGVGWSGWG